MPRIFSLLLFSILVSSFVSPAFAKDISLIDTAAVTAKFENAMALGRETLLRYPKPRYLIYKVAVSFSVTNGLDGNVAGKIPVGVVSAEFKGEYEQVSTRKESFTYVPASTIPTTVEDFGVLAFINRIQEKVSADLKTKVFVVSRAEHEEEFVVGIDGQGKLSFFSIVDIGGAVNLKNSHKIAFYFCLLGNDGKCVESP